MKLSVVIPNYNHAHQIGKSIQSIINQSYSCYELIIFDDNSSDNSVEIIKEFARKYSFIKLIQNKKNIGQHEISNLSLNIIKGDYLLVFSADDICESNFFLEASKQFKSNPDAGIFSALGYEVDQEDKFSHLIRTPLINNKSIYLFSLKSALKVEIMIIIKKIIQTKFIIFQLVKLINIPADKLAIA